jgi:hypothetical protein
MSEFGRSAVLHPALGIDVRSRADDADASPPRRRDRAVLELGDAPARGVVGPTTRIMLGVEEYDTGGCRCSDQIVEQAHRLP